MIKKCTCKHEGQDKLHGAGNRVFNLTQKGGGTVKVHRCTVCCSVCEWRNESKPFMDKSGVEWRLVNRSDSSSWKEKSTHLDFAQELCWRAYGRMWVQFRRA